MFENLTPVEWELKLKENGLALQWLSQPTLNQCLMAVEQNGMALKYVPKEKRTFEVGLRAIKQNSRVFQQLLTQAEQKMFFEYFSQQPEELKQLPKELLIEFALVRPDLMKGMEGVETLV